MSIVAAIHRLQLASLNVPQNFSPQLHSFPNDPKASGAVLVEEEEEPDEKPVAKIKRPAKPMPEAGETAEQKFAKLDINADDVLSGKEAKPYLALDKNEDGEITLDEFLAGNKE